MELLLASRSPRRAALLREAGYVIEQCDPPFDDPPNPQGDAHQTPQQLAANLAARKAFSLPPSPCVILAADTICTACNGGLLGTPTSRSEARTMIDSFVNNVHDVVTAVVLRPSQQGSEVTFVDTARVCFGSVNNDQSEAYLATNQWRGKAGGYNLFDRQADGWPIHVEGDPTTVVGLPMKKLVPALAKLGIYPT